MNVANSYIWTEEEADRCKVVFALDPITAVNFVLCVAILVLGIMAYGSKKDAMAPYIAIAFGLFGVSHVATLLGLAGALTGVLTIIRTLAHLIFIFALVKRWRL